MKRKTFILLPFLIFSAVSCAAYSADEMATVDYVDEQFADVVGYVGTQTRSLRNNMNATDNQLYDNQLVLRDMLNTKDADEKWIVLETEQKLAIPAINELHAEMNGKQDTITAENPLGADKVSGLSDVAKSGSYKDLVDAPDIPSLDNVAEKSYVDTELAKKLETSDLADYAKSDSVDANAAAIQKLNAGADTTGSVENTVQNYALPRPSERCNTAICVLSIDQNSGQPYWMELALPAVQ